METLIIITLGILASVLWVWAIIDIVHALFKNPSQKTIWLLIVVLFPILGSLLYLQLGRKEMKREARKFQPDFNRLR